MKIALVGGGTAGHIIPSLALIEKILEIEPKTQYFFVAANQSLDRKILKNQKQKKYFVPIAKLRRYFDFKNFTDIYKFTLSSYKSFKILKKEAPDLVFSKGGYVSVPFCLMARMLKIPIILHESDSSIGLANRLILPLCTQAWLSHPSSLRKKYLPKSHVLKLPILNRLINPNGNFPQADRLDPAKPNLLILGGSLGAELLNQIIFENRKDLKHHFNIIHIVGSRDFDSSYKLEDSYLPLEYVEDLGPLYEITDLCLSRAGAGTLSELENLNIPALLVPLSSNSSRGDQLLNAEYHVEKNNNSQILLESFLDYKHLLCKLKSLPSRSSKHSPRNQEKTIQKIYSLFLEVLGNSKRAR